MTPRIIIGDIHGGAQQLFHLLNAIRGIPRELVFLGDYVNRGTDSQAVIDMLVRLMKERTDVVFLRGNHDCSFLQFINRGCSDAFFSLGGAYTLLSYLGDVAVGNIHRMLLERIPSEHIKFLEDLQAFVEDDDLICSHTGVDPESPNDRSFDEMVLKSHASLFYPTTRLTKLVICGHYVQKSLIPFERSRVICLDTGCGTLSHGQLTALWLPERKVYQVDPLGKERWHNLSFSTDQLPIAKSTEGQK